MMHAICPHANTLNVIFPAKTYPKCRNFQHTCEMCQNTFDLIHFNHLALMPFLELGAEIKEANAGFSHDCYNY